MEGETEGLVSLLSALVVEELGHDLVPEGEEGAARCVGRRVLAVGARNLPNACGANQSRECDGCDTELEDHLKLWGLVGDLKTRVE